MRQLTYIFALTILIPSAISNYMVDKHLRFASFHAFEISVMSLCFCLGFFHIFFWARRKISSNQTARYIDYIYLLVASVGLLAAADIDDRIYRYDIENYVYIVQSTLHYGGLVTADKLKECDTDKEKDRCGKLSILEAFVTKARHDLDMEKSSHFEAKAKLDDFYVRAKAFPEIIEETKENLKMNGFDMDAEFAALKKGPFQPEDFRFLFSRETTRDALRQWGFALLAAALALRITRVTLELFNWQRDD